MIPAFNHSNVLPPFTGSSPTFQANVSPYDTTLCELIDRYDTSAERRAIITGLLDYRARFSSLGINDGYQWLSGSFVENIEAQENRAPNDIDVVTLAYRPAQVQNDSGWAGFFADNQVLFSWSHNKPLYKCDTYYIDLQRLPRLVVEDVIYWYGLFSHRRDGVWKGMLRLPLLADDAAARIKLASSVR